MKQLLFLLALTAYGQVTINPFTGQFDFKGGGGGGSGDVVGPSSSANNSVARFDGTTGKLLAGDPYFTYTPIPGSPVAVDYLYNLKILDGDTFDYSFISSNLQFTQAALGIERTLTSLKSSTGISGGWITNAGSIINLNIDPSTDWYNGAVYVPVMGEVIILNLPASATNNPGEMIGQTLLVNNSKTTTTKDDGPNDIIGLNVDVRSAGGTYYVIAAELAARTTSTEVIDELVGTRSIVQMTNANVTSAKVIVTAKYLTGTPPTNAWDISAETGWTSRFAGRVAVNKLTDDGSSALQVNGRIQAPLATPASSSAACVTGQTVWDTGFVYFCTATNTWKRAVIITF